MSAGYTHINVKPETRDRLRELADNRDLTYDQFVNRLLTKFDIEDSQG